jgi:hypothetical protein
VRSNSSVARCVIRRVSAVALTVTLLSRATPAAPQVIVAVVRESSVTLAFWLGFTRFAKRYLQEYFENRAAGMNDFDAYWNISFEIEARKVEAIIKKDLSNLSRDFGGRDPCPK